MTVAIGAGVSIGPGWTLGNDVSGYSYGPGFYLDQTYYGGQGASGNGSITSLSNYAFTINTTSQELYTYWAPYGFTSPGKNALLGFFLANGLAYDGTGYLFRVDWSTSGVASSFPSQPGIPGLSALPADSSWARVGFNEAFGAGAGELYICPIDATQTNFLNNDVNTNVSTPSSPLLGTFSVNQSPGATFTLVTPVHQIGASGANWC
jgi:hypothetical protein